MMTLASSTRIAVHVVIQDDSGNLAALLMALTALIGLLVQFGQFVASVIMLVSDTVQALDFTLKVFSIGLKSVAYGLGVQL